MNQIVVVFTGSVATIKDKIILDLLLETGLFAPTALYSQSATHFSEIWRSLKGTQPTEYRGVPILTEQHLRQTPIEIPRTILVSPLSANTLAQLATGKPTTAITEFIFQGTQAGRARCRVVVCPAMNTHMFLHPVTAPQLQTLTAAGVEVLGPISKLLACKEVGVGAMAEPAAIVAHLTCDLQTPAK